MALTKKIILFILSIIFTILLLAATTSFSADKFSGETLEPNSRIYTMEWTSIDNEDNKIFVCGAKLSTFDFSGRKYIFEYYLILLDNDNIVARFEVKAIQLSINNIDPLETESLEMKVYGAKITRENKDLFGATRDSNPKGKFLGIEFTQIDIEKDKQLIKTLFGGNYNLEIFIMPMTPVIVPILKNTHYKKNSGDIIDVCIRELQEHQNERRQTGIKYFTENSYKIG